MRRRQAAGVAGLLMFVVGFIVAPCLHNFDHRDDHEHAADGSVHFHGRAPAGGGTPSGRTAAPNTEHTHGAGSLAHFGVALTACNYFVVPQVSATVTELAPAAVKQEPSTRRWDRKIRSRGPPWA